jgi:HEAT repeat protein
MLMRTRGLVFCVLIVSASPADASEAVDPRATAALKLWNESPPEARRPVLRKLRRLGPRAAPAVEALTASLAAPDPKLRVELATTLGRIGPAARSAVPALLAALGDPVSEVRDAAALALGEIEPDPGAVIPALVSSVRARPDRRCLDAIAVLEKLGAPAVPALIGLIRNDDADVRSRASVTLIAIGTAAKPATAALIDGLRWPDPEVRQFVASALAAIGPEAVEPLIAALEDRDPRVRGGAVQALGLLGESARAAAPALVEVLFEDRPLCEPTLSASPDPGQWTLAGEPAANGPHSALQAIGETATPLLLARLDRTDRTSKVKAIQALGRIGSGAKSVVPRLIGLLDDPELRLEAASALGGFGSAARAAIPRLMDALRDPDPRFRARAAEALGRMGTSNYGTTTLARELEAAVTTLLMKDRDPQVRAAAVRALGTLGAQSDAALTALVALLRDPSVDNRLAALRSLAYAQRRRAADAIAIAGCLTDADSRVCQAAIAAIHDDDLALHRVLSRLAAALRSPDADLRAAAAQKLAQTGGQYTARLEEEPSDGAPGKEASPPPAAVVGPALRQTLADPEPRVRAAAIYAMPATPSEAAATVPVVAACLKDESPLVRLAAAQALSRFGSETRTAIPSLLEALDGATANDSELSLAMAMNTAAALQKLGPEVEAQMADRLLESAGKVDETGRHSVLSSLGQLDERTAERLLARLADPQTPHVAKVGALALLADLGGLGGPQLGDAPIPLTPALRKALPALRLLNQDDDLHVRTDARGLLAGQERRPEDLARLILDTAREEDPVEWSEFLFEMMGRLEPPASRVLLEGLKDPDDEVRTVACQAIGALGRNLPDLDEPAADGPDGENGARQRVQQQSEGLRAELADALVPLLNDPDTQVRWAAATGLYSLHSGERSVPALMAMAGDRTTRVRPGGRVQVTWRLGGSNNLNETNARGELVRLGAIQALGGFGAAAAPAIPLLVDILEHGDALSRGFAMNALAQLGPTAKPAVAALVARLRRKHDPDEAAALSRLNELRGWSLAENSTVFAIMALAALGPDAQAAVPPLIEALADPDPTLRRMAAHTLAEIGPTAHAAIPALVARLSDPDPSVGSSAAGALGTLGAVAVPALVEALDDRDTAVRQLAIAGLGQAGPAAATALPDLLLALADPDEEIRVPAAHALAQVARGPEVEPAIAALTAALKDSEPMVRQAAQIAITEIRDAEP